MRKNLLLKGIFISLIVLILSFSSTYAQISKGKVGLGLNYPGLGLKYFLSDKIAVEAKFQSEQDVSVTGIRGYYYFKEKAKVNIFVGGEMDTLSFTGEEGKGNGAAGEVFIGGEHFLKQVDNKFSIELDFGPALIFLYNTDRTESVIGIEFVINIGINWYFFK